MFTIKESTFTTITGLDMRHFAAHVGQGDAWGSFLKITAILEGSSKRAIGIKLGLDPNSEPVGHLEFFTALRLCREAKLISNEAFDFANYMRQVRNDLVHKSGQLNLDIETLRGKGFFQKYVARVESFVVIEDIRLTDGDKAHFTSLVAACISFRCPAGALPVWRRLAWLQIRE